MSLTIITPPAVEPISLTEAKTHLRVTGTDDDTLITSLIVAARDLAEQFLGRVLVVREMDWKFDAFEESVLDMPSAPLRSITHVKYLDSAGTEQTLATSVYVADTDSAPPRLALAVDQSWPTTRDTLNAVRVRFKAGYVQEFDVDSSPITINAAAHGKSDDDLVWLSNTGGALPGGLSEKTPYYVRDATTDAFNLAATSGGAAISITSAGTGTHFIGEVPASIRHAILLILGELYERREHAIAGVPIAEVSLSAYALMNPYRIVRF